jgi:hypothetical protein
MNLKENEGLVFSLGILVVMVALIAYRLIAG